MSGKKTISSKGEARDPKEKVRVVLSLDSELHDTLAKSATKIGLQTATYVKQIVQTGETLKGLIDQNKPQAKFRQSHFDQHVAFAEAMLAALFQFLGTELVITQEMLGEWFNQPSPAAIATTFELPLIKAGSEQFRSAFRAALKNPTEELNLVALGFVIAHRPLTNFDGRYALNVPDSYHPELDRAAWERFARNSIAYAIVTTEADRYYERNR